MIGSIFWLVLISPLIIFFIVIHCFKTSENPLDQEMQLEHETKAKKYFRCSTVIAISMILLTPLSFGVLYFVERRIEIWVAMGVPALGLIGIIFCLTFAALGIKHARRANISSSRVLWQKVIACVGYFGFLTNLGMLVLLLAGMGWGRPLRVNGKVLKPTLEDGDAWALGERPDVKGLDEPTRKALEALWLHDAKKEYASVPAFSRLGWQLAALAAPPDLLRDVHIAAIQEIEHAKKCFALAAGFGHQAQTVLPMPDMLKDSYPSMKRLLPDMASESLSDGCLLEGFNADIAARSADICRDAASLKVIKKIAREERSHAELSWRILEFCYRKDAKTVGDVLKKEMNKLSKSPRPTASSSQNLPIVQAADAEKLIAYGRLPDTEFDVIWNNRMTDTQQRVLALLSSHDMTDEVSILDVNYSNVSVAQAASHTSL